MSISGRPRTVIKLSLLTRAFSIVLGFILALAKQSPRKLFNAPARLYIWLFRSMPLLVLLIFVYNMPQALPSFAPVLNDPFWAGLLAMVLSEAAYIAEIHRGGLLSIPKGQSEAARALGLRYAGTQWRVVIPQALRVALPALANEYIAIVKLSSLVSVISLTGILMVGQRLYSQNFLVMETMAAVAFYYILIVTVFDFLLKRLETGSTSRNVKPRVRWMKKCSKWPRRDVRQWPAALASRRSRRCRRLSCIKPITMSKCWARSACKFSPAKSSPSLAHPAPVRPR